MVAGAVVPLVVADRTARSASLSAMTANRGMMFREVDAGDLVAIGAEFAADLAGASGLGSNVS